MEDRPMTFTEHLSELRLRLRRALVSVFFAFVATWTFHEELFELLARPVLSSLRRHNVRSLIALQVTETITVHLEVALVTAIFIALPYVCWQIWAFISPGLYEKEKRVVRPVVLLVSGFFMLGVVFCYFVFLPMVVDYLITFTMATGTVSLTPTIERTFSLTLTFLLVFGLLFELPLLMFFLALLGVVGTKGFLTFSKYFIVLAFVIGAIFTPPDVLSQTLMAVPLCLLYFVGIACSFIGERIRGTTGTSKANRYLMGGTFAFFASLVIVVSWVWEHTPQKYSVAVLPDASFAFRISPGSGVRQFITPPIEDSVLIYGNNSHNSFLTESALSAVSRDQDPLFSVLDDEHFESVLIARPLCASKLVPDGLASEEAVIVTLKSFNEYLKEIRIQGGSKAMIDWANSLTPWTVPEVSSPIGRVLGWSIGDIEVNSEIKEIRVVAPSTRINRMMGELLSFTIALCGPDDKL